jgi:hypothetical protein
MGAPSKFRLGGVFAGRNIDVGEILRIATFRLFVDLRLSSSSIG